MLLAVLTDISKTAAEVIVRISRTLTDAQVVKMSGMSPAIFSPTQDYAHLVTRLKNARFPDPKVWYLYALNISTSQCVCAYAYFAVFINESEVDISTSIERGQTFRPSSCLTSSEGCNENSVKQLFSARASVLLLYM